MPVSKSYVIREFERLIKTSDLNERTKGVIGRPYKQLIRYTVCYFFGFTENSPEKIERLQASAHKSRVNGAWKDVMYASREMYNKIKSCSE